MTSFICFYLRNATMSADSTVPLGFLIYIFLGDLMVIFYVEISSAAA